MVSVSRFERSRLNKLSATGLATAFLAAVSFSEVSQAQWRPASTQPPSPLASQLAEPPEQQLTAGKPATVFTNADIRRLNIRKLDQLFQGLTPGIIAADRGDSYSTAWRARGNTKVNTPSQIRVFLNGIELEDPAWINRINPEFVDRVEVYSGLAASAQYGATGAVVMVKTKRGGTSPNTTYAPLAFYPVTTILVSGGAEESFYDKKTTAVQRHALNLAGGHRQLSYFAGGGYSSNGMYADLTSLRGYDGNISISSTNRLFSFNSFGMIGYQSGGVPEDRALTTPPPGVTPIFETDTERDFNTYAYGARVMLSPVSQWRQEVYTGNSIRDDQTGTVQERVVSPGPLPFTLSDLRNKARNFSFGYKTSFEFPSAGILDTRLHAGYEQVSYRSHNMEEVRNSATATPPSTLAPSMQRIRTISNRISGAYTGVDFVFARDLTLSGGVRWETNHVLSDNDLKQSWLPYVSARYTVSADAMSFTPRVAYSQLNSKRLDPDSLLVTRPAVISNRFSTFEGGFDLGTRRGFNLGVTGFMQEGRDNRVNPRLYYGSVFSPPSTSPFSSLEFVEDEFLTLRTTGVETWMSWSYGAFSTGGAFTYLRTKVKEVRSRYIPLVPPGAQQYQEGDQIKSFPSENGSLWISYTHRGTTGGIETRYFGAHEGPDINNASPAATEYPSFAIVNLNLFQQIAPRVQITGYVHNVANTERYALSNRDYVQGRRFGLGVRAQY